MDSSTLFIQEPHEGGSLRILSGVGGHLKMHDTQFQLDLMLSLLCMRRGFNGEQQVVKGLLPSSGYLRSLLT